MKSRIFGRSLNPKRVGTARFASIKCMRIRQSNLVLKASKYSHEHVIGIANSRAACILRPYLKVNPLYPSITVWLRQQNPLWL